MPRIAPWLLGGLAFCLACGDDGSPIGETSTTGTGSDTTAGPTSSAGPGGSESAEDSGTDASTSAGPESTSGTDGGSSDSSSSGPPIGEDEFELTSPSHQDGATFANAYTCAAGGFFASIIPQLDWTAGPEGTQYYALTFLDVTLTEGGGQNAALGYHWALWNIPANVLGLEEGFTDAGSIGAVQASPAPQGAFLGPCPMGELHTYEFTLYALASTITVQQGGQATTVVQNAVTTLEADHLAFAKLSGTSNASP